MPHEKLQALQDTTLDLLRSRGHLTDEQAEKFFAVGYGQKQILEIVLGLAQKMMSNYMSHLTETPEDESFKPFAWAP